jgi:lipopolysaccharide biosynthesis regulator YciM
MLDEASAADAGEGDLVVFRRAGAEAPGRYHCTECGYGVTVQTVLPRCPMCQGESWELVAPGPLERAEPLL